MVAELNVRLCTRPPYLYMQRPIVFSPTETVKTAIAILVNQKHCGCGVVANGGQVLGLFSTKTVAPLCIQGEHWENLPLGEVMEPVVAIPVDQINKPKVILKLFNEHNVHCLPVVDKQGNCLGLITLKDFWALASQAIEQAEATTRKLEETERNLQEAQRLAQIGSWEFNLENQVLTWSAEIYRIFELDPLTVEPSYELFLSCLPPAEAQLLHQAYQKHLGDRLPYDVIHSLVLPDGRLKYIRERCETQFDPEGRPLLSRGTAQDITSSHQAQLTLQKLVRATADVTGEDFFRELVTYLAQALHISHALVGEKKADYLQTLGYWAEGELQENLAYDYSQTPCQTVLEQGEFSCGADVQSLFPHDLELISLGAQSYLGVALKNTHNEVIGNLCVWGQEYWPAGKQEEALDIIRIFAARASAELERQQTYEKLQQFNQSLELKVAERIQELAQLSRLQQAILDSSDYAIISTDLRGVIKTFNAGAEKMLGYRAQEVVEQVTPELFSDPQEIRERLLVNFGDSPFRVLLEQSLSGQMHEQEWTNIRKDGSRFPITLSLSPLRNDQEEVIGFLGISKDISRQKEAEQENLRLRERLALIVSASPAVLFTCQTTGNYDATFISDNITNMTGYAVEDFLHIPNFWAERLHPEDQGRILAELPQLFERGYHTHEYRFRLANGSYAWMSNQLHLVRDSQGNPLEIVGYFADISLQKQNELERQQLLQELTSFKQALDESAIVAVTNAQGIITYVNQRFSEISGYSTAETLGQTHSLVKSGVHGADFYRHLWGTITQGKIWRGEICNRAKDGRLYWLESTIIPFLDAQGKPYQYLAVRFDLTQRKQAELAQEQSNHLLLTISQAQSQFITAANRLTIFEGLLESLLDLTNSEYGFIGEIMFCAEGAAEIQEGFMKVRGVPYLKTHSITNIAWDEETQKFYQDNYEQGMEFTNMETLFGAVVMTGKPVIANHPQTDPRAGGIPQGHPPLNAFLGLPFFRGDHLSGMVGIANRPKGYTAEIIDYLQPFLVTCSNLIEGYRIEKKRKEIESQLSRTNEELSRATRLKDEFLANMSHELRTPLNAILINIQVLQEQIYGALNAKQLQSLTTIEKSGEHLLALINEILDLAKIESGQMVLHQTDIAINQLCESSLAFVKQQAFKKRLQIVTQIPSSCPPFWGDERLLRQALINLLANAVKFTPVGGQITLSVSGEEKAENSPWLKIAITDTGIGIAKEDQNKLFQPFRQIDSALNRRYEGTGLGLALVIRIVELHGGRVEVTSEVGQGSCFTLLLPWGVQDWPEPTLQQPHLSMHSLAAESNLPLILMINADLASVGSLTNYLEAKHYQLRTVADWDGAIAVLEEVRPALILVNLQSSQNQQAEGVRRLRQLPQGSRIPLLALIAADGDRQRYLTWGIDECLSRPFKLIELTTLIEENLNDSP